MATEHVVITQHIVGSVEQWQTVYSFDGFRFPTRAAAVAHGWEAHGHDDFNVAVLSDGRLSWFGWMDEQLPDHDLAEIAEQIGVEPAAAVR